MKQQYLYQCSFCDKPLALTKLAKDTVYTSTYYIADKPVCSFCYRRHQKQLTYKDKFPQSFDGDSASASYTSEEYATL